MFRQDTRLGDEKLGCKLEHEVDPQQHLDGKCQFPHKLTQGLDCLIVAIIGVVRLPSFLINMMAVSISVSVSVAIAVAVAVRAPKG